MNEPLTIRLVKGERADELLAGVEDATVVEIDARTASDLELFGNGGFTPLTGFMGRADYDSVVEKMRLTSGQPWSLPITLMVSPETAEKVEVGRNVGLRYHGRIIAVVHVSEIYTPDKEREAELVFRTTERAHPGVDALLSAGPVYIAGDVAVLAEDIHTEFGEYRFTPTQCREIFEDRGWKRIVAFQTRNPVHRAHEYLQKCALEMVDGLVLHPLVGETKSDDIPAVTRMRCYEVLLEKYYPKDRTLLAVFPAAMRYAGPREAVFHALVRRNYGMTHFIVGRDHAGVGNYYGTYDAQEIFSNFTLDELGIQPVFFDYTFYCKGCGGLASDKTCPHPAFLRIYLSGTQVRQRLREGKLLPTEFSRPEVARILVEAYHPEMREERQRRESGAVKRKKVAVIGLDCAPPELVFDRFKDDLPNLRLLMDRGIHGKLSSTMPPLTVPAWTSMMTSRDPGELGLYGFRNRKTREYGDHFLATSSTVREKRAWETVSDHGRKIIAIGVPQTYPPPAVNGVLISDFLTPSTNSQYTYPPELKATIEKTVGKYMLDVEDIRSENRELVLRQIYEMTDKRFKLAEHLLTEEDWDLFFLVEMATDRIHHAFWKDLDPDHPRHDPKSPFQDAIREFYKFLDHRIGDLLKLFDADTTVIVVSDHGAKSMIGGVAVNDFLAEKGWLELAEKPETPASLTDCPPDWSRTRAWAEGGYVANVHMNVKGREPEGTILPDDYEAERDRLARDLEEMTGPDGSKLGNVVFRPDRVYSAANGIAPDLIVYLGDLSYRSVGAVGHSSWLVPADGSAADDANHAADGIFIMAGPNVTGRGAELEGLEIYDVAPTLLHLFGLGVPAQMRGRVIDG